MVFGGLLGNGFLLIGGLVLIGAGLLVLSLLVNFQVAESVRADLRHREKLLEYHRNIFSQLGVILIGIGVSLFIFYFQQSYQERNRRNNELQQITAKIALRMARGGATVASLSGFDELLDEGGAYSDPEKGGNNAAGTAEGEELTAQIEKLLLVERYVDLREFEVLNMSRDFENSAALNELDPNQWFNIVRDESDVRYATTQLLLDFKELHDTIGNMPLEQAVADPGRQKPLKRKVLDIYYDADTLRQSSRRLIGRACWFLSHGPGFIGLRPVDEIEAESSSHREWLDRAQPFLAQFSVGSTNCFKLLGYRDASWSISGGQL